MALISSPDVPTFPKAAACTLTQTLGTPTLLKYYGCKISSPSLIHHHHNSHHNSHHSSAMLHQNPRRQCGLSIAKWQRLCSLIDIFLRIPELAVYFTYINDPDGDYEDRVDLFLNRHGDEFWSDAEQGLWRLSDDSTGGRDM